MQRLFILLFAVATLSFMGCNSQKAATSVPASTSTPTAQARQGQGQRGQGQPGDRSARLLTEMTNQLNLSSDQVTKVQSIMDRYASTTKRPERGDQEAMQAFRSKMEEQDKEITTVLTEKQQAAYTRMKEAQRANRGGRGGGGRPGGGK